MPALPAAPSLAAHPPLPTKYFPAVPPWCVGGIPGSLQSSHATHPDSHVFLGYHINKALASPSQPSCYITCADPHVLLRQRLWAVFWGPDGELPCWALHQHRSTSLPTQQHFSGSCPVYIIHITWIRHGTIHFFRQPQSWKRTWVKPWNWNYI